MFDLPSLRNLMISVPPFILALCFHEFSHAIVADRMGDPTPRNEGRLTLNPLKHLDIVGTLMLLLFQFGWAKPVPINPYNFRRIRLGNVLVAAAGPLSNLLLAYLSVVIFKLGIVPAGAASEMLYLFIWINLILAIFNLIPVPPLDGSHLLEAMLSQKALAAYYRIQPYGPVILILLVMTNAFQYVLMPLASLMLNLFLYVLTPFI